MPAELQSTRELAASFNKKLSQPKGTRPVALRAIAIIRRTVTPDTPRKSPGSVISNWQRGDILIGYLHVKIAESVLWKIHAIEERGNGSVLPAGAAFSDTPDSGFAFAQPE
jgi:hypothetical protein